MIRWTFLSAGSTSLGHGMLFWQPARRKALVGLGAAFTHEADGPYRFRTLAAALDTFGASLIRSDRDAFPILAGGAFRDHVNQCTGWSEFPAAACLVPNVLLQIEGAEAMLRSHRAYRSRNVAHRRCKSDL